MSQDNFKEGIVDNITAFTERKKHLNEKLGPANILSSVKNAINNRISAIEVFLGSIKPKIFSLRDSELTLLDSLLKNINSEINYVITNFREDALDNFNERISDYNNQLQALNISISTSDNLKLRELEELITKYRTTVEKIEINTNSLDFKDTVKTLDQKIIWWKLGVFIISALLVLVTVLFLYEFSYDFNSLKEFNTIFPANDRPKDAIQILLYFGLFKTIILRLFVLSILIYLLKFISRNYNALMHIRTTNQHKANILDAAVRILNISPAENEEVRNSILQLAGQAIFSNYKTGYLNKEDAIDIGFFEKALGMIKK